MLTVRFIRHAESAANAGEATSDPASIPLTPLGHHQAQALSLSFGDAPSLIVCSSFLRVQQTAAPTLSRFSMVPSEIWPVHEFTYLSPSRCKSTTAEDRRPWVNEFWERSDPNMLDGPGAECFAGFIARVQATLDRLAVQRIASVAVFSHGQFLQALRWLLLHRPASIDSQAMRAFRAIDLVSPIANGEGFTAAYENDSWILLP